MSNKKVLLMALICGLLTAIAVNYYLKSVKDTAIALQTKRVAVANARIPARTLVTANMISFKNVPIDYAHGSAVTDANQVVGYTTRAEIEAGEQVLQTKLVPRENSGTTLAYSVPLGMRAVSISVTEQSGVSGLLIPGDRVDVVGTLDIEEQSKDPNVNTVKFTMSHLMLQNVEVLAVGKNYTEPGAQQGDKKDQNQGGAATVTLAVPADRIQYLVAVTDKGKLTLALRSPADKSEQNRPPMNVQQLLK
ncbi:MAG: Flp pilus assembly protein CpaB [Eubacteriales bacterium]